MIGFYDFFCVEFVFVVCECYEVGIFVYMFIGDYLEMVKVIVIEVGILFRRMEWVSVDVVVCMVMMVFEFDVLSDEVVDKFFVLFLVIVCCVFSIKVCMIDVLYCCGKFCVMVCCFFFCCFCFLVFVNRVLDW